MSENNYYISWFLCDLARFHQMQIILKPYLNFFVYCLLDILDYFTFGIFQKEYFVYLANLDALWKIQITHCVCARFSENLKEITMKFLLCRTVSNIYTKLMFGNMKKRL